MLLYIHIPYCDSKCYYCAFNSYVDKFNTQKKYMEALLVQLKFELKRFRVSLNSIETIFIGGGTPSSMNSNLYIPLFKLINQYLKKDCEITIEANPNSASKEWLKGVIDLGVNRVSFGVQSFNDIKLKELNRSHSSKEAKESVINAFNLGLKNISIDLIYNYKNDTKELLFNDIKEAFSLPINHISTYELTIEENTSFNNRDKQENEQLANFVVKEIEKNNFKAYEVSNFGGYQSIHNKGYWSLKNYIGVGAGAVGFLEDRRLYPVRDIDLYIKNPLNIEEEILSKEEILTEKIFLGLRSSIGIEKKILNSNMLKLAKELEKENKLYSSKTTFYNKNFFLSDEIALYILR